MTRRIGGKDVFRFWRRHAHQAGEVITAWNDLHAALLEIFRTLTVDDWEVSVAIWHSHQSDKSQREMLISAATEVLRFKSAKVLACIRWLKDTTDKFSPFRNDPAHTPMSIAVFESSIVLREPNIFATNSQSVTRLYEKPLESTWKKLRSDLFLLCAYAIELNSALNNSQFAPLPHRRRLLIDSLVALANAPKASRSRKTRRAVVIIAGVISIAQ